MRLLEVAGWRGRFAVLLRRGRWVRWVVLVGGGGRTGRVRSCGGGREGASVVVCVKVRGRHEKECDQLGSLAWQRALAYVVSRRWKIVMEVVLTR